MTVARRTDLDVDVAIVGGGACGVMTALRASQNPDLGVAVFEKDSRAGCNAAISSGSLAAGGTRFQRAHGITDSPEQHAAEILAASGDPDSSDVVHAVCRAAPAYVEWIADDLDYPMQLGVDMPRAGMSVPRLHTDADRRGGGRLMAHLRHALERRPNVAFVDGAPAIGLIHDGHAVHGVEVAQNDAVLRVAAATTVLALDGFAANPDLMKQHCNELGEPFYGGVSTSTGDAIPWLSELGASFRHMGSCLRHGLIAARHGTRLSPALPFNDAILINHAGRRFIDEQSVGYSGLAIALQQQPGQQATLVWDDIAMQATRDAELMRESIAAGAIQELPGLSALAAHLSMPVQDLLVVVEPLPGRRELHPPFHVATVTHGVLATQGGAVIDNHGQVLQHDGSTIPGVRAGGGTAVGLSGPDSAGYSSGNGLLAAFGMGWIIGNDLANGTASGSGSPT